MLFPFLEATSWIVSSHDGLVSLGKKTLASVAGRRWRQRCAWLLLRWGWWTLGQRPWMVDVRRGNDLGIHGGQLLHEAEQLLACLG
jgi:hypothetical protein